MLTREVTLSRLTILVLCAAVTGLWSGQQGEATIGGSRDPNLAVKSQAEIVEVLKSPSDAERSRAVKEILYRFTDDKVDPAQSDLARLLVEGALTGYDRLFRVACVQGLYVAAGLASEPALDALVGALRLDADYWVRYQAAYTLQSQTSRPAVREALTRAAQTDPSAKVRKTAAQALGVEPAPFEGKPPEEGSLIAATIGDGDARLAPPPGSVPLAVSNLDGWAALWVREAAERLGYQVEWDREEKACTISKGKGPRVRLIEGGRSTELNGQAVGLVAAPVIDDGQMYVPLGFLAEALALEFSLDSGVGVAHIWPISTTPEPTPAREDVLSQPTG